MATGSETTTARKSDNSAPDTSADLEAQVHQLQTDIKSIAATLASLAETKVAEAKSMAKAEVKQLARTGQNAVEDVQDELGEIEKQVKDVIRERPITAVLGALALGYVLAVVSR